ncbi:ammonium transporter [Ureaplasma canigenitalium]|uniref:ammonium transporter n=1 Tax=Ureaplasma canigenitalium TaxID=42092 RepID=UPI000AF9D2DE|nr:ammonium transporter [Ureaplasma canigenitalium]
MDSNSLPSVNIINLGTTDIFFSSQTLKFIDVSKDNAALLLKEVGFNPTNTLLAALAIAFVLLMTPGLALFYGGLVRRKSILTIINQCMISLGVTTIIWVFGGFSLAFGPSVGRGIIGDVSSYFAFRNIIFDSEWKNIGMVFSTFTGGVPMLLFFGFQLSFAIITPPLMVGAFADRMKFKNYIVFLVLWQYLIYIPFCHWVWGQGFLNKFGVLDWAGGIVIHTTAGFGALATSFVLGRRKILRTEKNTPNNIPLVIVGATLLFFGWFGFNVGGASFIKHPSTHQSIEHTLIATTWINSVIAVAVGIIGWVIMESIFNKNHKPTGVGLVTGGIAGLATITPAAGYVPLWASVPIALAAVAVCFLFCKIMHHSKIDDSLEVFAVHGMGGVVGSLLVGAFAHVSVFPDLWVNAAGYQVDSVGHEQSVYGLLFSRQLSGVALAGAYSFVMTIIIAAITQPRLKANEQLHHIDYINHGEDAYNFNFVYARKDEINEAMKKQTTCWTTSFGGRNQVKN